MKKFIILVFIAIIMLTLSANAEETPFDDGSVIVVMNTGAERSVTLYNNPFDGLGIADSECIFEKSHGPVSLFSRNNATRILKLTLEEKGADKVLETIDRLNSLPQVKYAEPNYILKPFAEVTEPPIVTNSPIVTEPPTVNDPLYLDGSQQALNLIGADKVWDFDIDCSEVVVGIVDSGIQLNHEDLQNNIWINTREIPDDGIDNDENGYIDDTNGWDFGDNDNDPTYAFAHGVHVAGIVSAVTNNNKGVASLARNAKLAALKIFDSHGGAELSDAIEAFNYAKDNNITILNNSWGLFIFSEEIEAELKSIEEVIKNTPEILYVCAAGNTDSAPEPDNDKTPIYPASYSEHYDNVISVANTTLEDTLANDSHYGKNSVDMAAPGSNIMSTYSGGGYFVLSGTSMSAPMIASAAAVMKAFKPDITPAEIKQILMSSSDKLDVLLDVTVSGGRLNAYAAVSEIIQMMPSPSPSPTPTPTPTPTSSPTPTPTSTPSPSPTSTPTMSPTLSPSPSPSPAPTPTLTPSPSPSPTSTPTTSPTLSPSPFRYSIKLNTEENSVKIVISENISEEPAGKLVIADYDKNGVLLAVTVNDITSDVFSHSLSDNRIHTVKAFIWNSLSEMYPLSEIVHTDVIR